MQSNERAKRKTRRLIVELVIVSHWTIVNQSNVEIIIISCGISLFHGHTFVIARVSCRCVNRVFSSSGVIRSKQNMSQSWSELQRLADSNSRIAAQKVRIAVRRAILTGLF